MTIYPAIDIRGGKCVRLVHGELKNEKIYGDPMEFAKKWEAEGSSYLHIIDLDGAFATGDNSRLISKIAQSVKIPVQVGGGVRTRDDIKKFLDSGCSRVVLGTMAVSDVDSVIWAKSTFGDQITVGIDAVDGMVQTKGWTANTNLHALDLAKQMRKLGIATLIYTDIMRDGTMQGVNIERTEEIVKSTWMNVLGAGGINSLADIVELRGTGACGAIIGTALYEGAFTLRQAIACR